MRKTAAALIIGDEILTGKVQESNLGYLARELFALGIELRRAVICPDEIEIIAEDVNQLRKNYDLVFTSGGVGPTHDDVTMLAVARAFGRKLIRSPEIEGLLREFYRSRLTESHLRMADIPEGGRLLSSREMRLPTVSIENVYIFPGIPELFRMKFPVLREMLGGEAKMSSRAVYLRSEEGQIAGPLSEVAARHPGVKIGSYPRWGDEAYRVKVTFDGNDAEAIESALQAFVRRLPAEEVVEVEE